MIGMKLGKIKRAIIEITECEAAAVDIHRIEQIVYQAEVNSGALTDIAKIAADGVVVWVDGVLAIVRERFESLMAEAKTE